MRSKRPLAFMVLLAFLLTALPVAAATRISGPLPAFGDVVSYRVTPDGSRVIYLADSQISDKYELFSAPTDGSVPPVRLHADLLPDRELTWYDLTPNGTRVVYRIGREVGNRSEQLVYSAPSDGSVPATPLRLPADLRDNTAHGFGTQLNDTALIIEALNFDQRVWEIIRVDLSGVAPAERIVTVPVTDSTYNAVLGFTPDRSRLVYLRVDYARDTHHAYSVALEGSSAPVRLDLGEHTRYVTPLGFSGDGRYLLLDATGGADGRNLESVPLDGTARRILTASDDADEWVGGLVRIIGGNTVLFLCWQPDTGRNALCGAPIEGRQPASVLIDTYEVNIATAQFTRDGSRLIMTGWSGQTSVFEPAVISVPLDGSRDVQILYSNTTQYASFDLIGVTAAAAVVAQHVLLEGLQQLVAIPLAGGAPRLLSPPLLATDGLAAHAVMSNDDQRLLFIGRPVGQARDDLYSAPLNGSPTAPVLLSAPDRADGGIDSFVLRGNRVVLQGTLLESGVMELFGTSADISGLGFDRFAAHAREGATLPLSVTLSAALPTLVTAEYELLNIDDEIVVSGTISLEPGQTSTVIPLTVPDDKIANPDQMFTLRLTNLSGAAPRITANLNLMVRDADAFRAWFPLVGNQAYHFWPARADPDPPIDANAQPRLE